MFGKNLWIKASYWDGCIQQWETTPPPLLKLRTTPGRANNDHPQLRISRQPPASIPSSLRPSSNHTPPSESLINPSIYIQHVEGESPNNRLNRLDRNLHHPRNRRSKTKLQSNRHLYLHIHTRKESRFIRRIQDRRCRNNNRRR